MTRKRYIKLLRAVFTSSPRDGYIEMITSLAQLTRTPYSEVFAAHRCRVSFAAGRSRGHDVHDSRGRRGAGRA